MTILAGLALALVLLALASRADEASNEQIVRRLARENDPRVLGAAAAVLEGRGMRLTADALRTRAVSLASSAETAGVPPAALPSPIPEASSTAWTAFVRAVAGPSPAGRAGDRLGIFSIHLRRLAQLGCVENVRRGQSGHLTATWRRPRSEGAFLANPPLQYRIFAASIRGLRIALRRGHEAGEDIVDGEPVTLSGLLAVAHRLGVAGLDAWLMSRTERSRQQDASALFRRTNGIF